jgi:hypothetical protein
MGMQVDTSVFVEDIAITLGFPIVFFMIAGLWFKLISPKGFRAGKRRMVLATGVLPLFLVSLVMTLRSDREIMKALWDSAPVLYAIVYLACGLAVLAGITSLFYWQLRPSKWRSQLR